MYKNFADFEAEIDQFDHEMNAFAHQDESKPKSTPSPSSSDNDPM